MRHATQPSPQQLKTQLFVRLTRSRTQEQGWLSLMFRD